MWEKIVSSVLITCFLLGGMVITLPGKVSAAPASPVGVVDFGLLVNQHPDMPKGNEALQAEAEQAKKEYEEKAPSLNDQEKKALDLQLGQRIENKRQELLSPIIEQINAAIKAVADAKGLTIVVYKNTVVYGGQDITAEVGKKITGK